MGKIHFAALFLLFFVINLQAQKITVEGYAYESDNRGYLNLVKVRVLDKESRAIKAEVESNKEGFYTLEVPSGSNYELTCSKSMFENKIQEFSTINADPTKKIYLKSEMSRKPGYIFDVTLAKQRVGDNPTDAIEGAQIEIYNNTTKTEEMAVKNYPHHNFNFTFEQGNHYTIMIRKEGFFNKRMEAYVNVDGCILCFEGIGSVTPGVTDNLTEGNKMGTLLANVELQPIELDKSIKIENIYYDYNKHNIRPDAAGELDKLILVLKNNPALIVELGSHTDSRGKDEYNLSLSQKRAKAAVDYIVEIGKTDHTRISGRGYGETVLVNKCSNGVKCADKEHEFNRRTELKIVGIKDFDPYKDLSLAQIIEQESFDKMLEEIQNGGQIKVEAGEELPPEITNPAKETPKPIEPEVTQPEITQPVITQPEITQPVITQPEISTNNPQPKISQPEIVNETVETVETVIGTAEEVVQTEVRTTPPPKPTSPTITTTVRDLEAAVPMEKPVKKVEEVIASERPGTLERIDENIGSNEPVVNTDAVYEVPTTSEVFKVKKEVKTHHPRRSTRKVIGGKKIVEEQEVNSVTFVNKPKPLPAKYTGYRVEFFTSPSKLPSSHVIFNRHGNITIERLKDGKYAYLLGEFNERADAQQFMVSVMVSRYPDAQVVAYKNSKRLR